MEHYLECGKCNTIDNNSINLKYAYIKNNNRKEEFNIVKFDDLEDEYEAYIIMETVYWEKNPQKSIYKINYIKDIGSEYNNYVLINWYRGVPNLRP